MYWTTPSGTRYQTGLPSCTRARQSVEEIAIAGISISLTPVSGPTSTRSWPGRVTPTNWAMSHSRCTSFQVMICSRASAPVMKNRSASGRNVRRSRRVSAVYVGPGRSMSTRDTVNRGFEAVATTVIR